jgi:hypothetical protein
MTGEGNENKIIVSCLFEDEVLDMQAEIDGLQVRMQAYNCLVRFK